MQFIKNILYSCFIEYVTVGEVTYSWMIGYFSRRKTSMAWYSAIPSSS